MKIEKFFLAAGSFILALFLSVAASSGPVFAAEGAAPAGEGKPDVTGLICPVSGHTVSADVYLQFGDNQRIYFCSPGCTASFKWAPLSYVTAESPAPEKAAGIEVEEHEHALPALPPEAWGKIQALDPVTGAPAQTRYRADYEGRTVYFSSPESMEEFEADPEKHMPAVLLQTEWIQRKDPVNGETAKIQFFVDYMGRRIHFSNAESATAFQGEPEKYLEKVNAELVPAQKLDPVSGEPVIERYYADYMGRRIYFAGAESVDKFIDDYRKYLDVLDEQLEERRRELTTPPAEGRETAEITQKACPVMGAPINPNLYVDYEGRRIYFCCSSCAQAFENDPEKYLKKLDEQTGKGMDAGAAE